MITKEEQVEINRLYYGEHLKVGTIARELRLHPDTVKGALGFKDRKPPAPREGLIAPYVEFIEQTLEEYPGLRATRIKQMIELRGYIGSIYPVRRVVAKYRPKQKRAYQDLVFFPAEFAQVDWGDFGHFSVAPGKTRKLNCFVMVLAYSRRLFARFYFDQKSGSLLDGHVEAFTYFGGSPRKVLYDNMKTAVIKNLRGAIEFNPSLLEFAAHYCFSPRACNPRSGWEKGRVEKAIRYLRDNFSPKSRSYSTIDELNDQLMEWLSKESDNRPWQDDSSKTVLQAFSEENLNKLPEPFPAYTEAAVRVCKRAYVRFDTNIYSVPPNYVGEMLILRASIKKVLVYADDKIVAEHSRNFTKEAKVIDPEHVDQLVEKQKIARKRQHKATLIGQLRNGDKLLEAWKTVEEPLIKASNSLGCLLASYTREDIENAIDEALVLGTPRADSIAYLLKKQPNPKPIATINFQRKDLNKLTIDSHDLSQYDEI